jgi:DNA invertase Pin-like site-specific DNA recombinase
MSIIAYARVSTDGQSLESQQAALTAAGAERVFAEKISGAVTDRKALTRAIAELGPGDCLLVTRLDRSLLVKATMGVRCSSPSM